MASYSKTPPRDYSTRLSNARAQEANAGCPSGLAPAAVGLERQAWRVRILELQSERDAAQDYSHHD